VDNHRIHAFSLPLRGRCISFRHCGLKSAESFHGIQAAVAFYGFPAAFTFHGFEAAVAFYGFPAAFTFHGFKTAFAHYSFFQEPLPLEIEAFPNA